MNYARFVCLIAFSLSITSTSRLPAQSLPMARGVSVQMAKSTNATPMPEADKEDAWVVTIRRDEGLHFGTEMVSPASLAEVMKKTPHNPAASLYIKADARASFSSVQRVLLIGREAGFSSPVLLTNQPEVPALGKLVAPKGLEVLLADAASDTTVVQLVKSGQSGPDVKLNNQGIHLTDLQQALNRALQNQEERVVVLRADGQLPFAQVAQVIDACASVKAKVVLPIAEL